MLVPQVHVVCHRLDDLEKSNQSDTFCQNVCHRLDDLENLRLKINSPDMVCHRLDDLEMNK